MSPGLDPAVTTRSVVFAVALAALLVGHALGDHIAQTDRQAEGKAGPGRAGLTAMAGHLLGYHLTAGTVLVATMLVLGLPLSPAGVGAGLAFSALTHGVLDRRWPVRAILRATRSPRFAETSSPVCGMYAADQALHHGALLVSALLVAAL
jgi:hypothetical protein